MFSDPIRSVMEPKKLLLASPESSVHAAAVQMSDSKVGAILVVDKGRLVGIFTERDTVFRVIAAKRDPLTTPLSQVMTTEPKTVGPNESFGHALQLMREHGFRHAPVIEDGRPIGIVSARGVLDPDLEEFASEAYRRKSIRREAGYS